jgi:hypothetical protein
MILLPQRADLFRNANRARITLFFPMNLIFPRAEIFAYPARVYISCDDININNDLFLSLTYVSYELLSSVMLSMFVLMQRTLALLI